MSDNQWGFITGGRKAYLIEHLIEIRDQIQVLSILLHLVLETEMLKVCQGIKILGCESLRVNIP